MFQKTKQKNKKGIDNRFEQYRIEERHAVKPTNKRYFIDDEHHLADDKGKNGCSGMPGNLNGILFKNEGRGEDNDVEGDKKKMVGGST